MLRVLRRGRYCGPVRAPRLRPWMIVSAAWILPAIFAAINRIVQAHLQGWEPATVRDVLFEFGDWLLYALLTPGVFAVSKRWPVVRPQLLRRVLIHLLFAVLFCIAWATSGQILRLVLMLIFARDLMARDQFWQQFGLEWLSWIFITLPFGVAVYLCLVGVEHAIRYFVEVRER